MAGNVLHELWLDLLKETQLVPDEVTVRVGEGGSQTFKVHLTEGGEPYRVEEGWSATIRLLTAASNTKTQDAEIGGDGRDELTVTLADEMLTDEGTCKLAYFMLIGPDDETLTTEGFKLRIMGSTSTKEGGSSWDARMERLIKDFELQVAHIKEKEAERVANEEIRIANEELRKKQEDRREKQERQREAAEKKREQASKTAVQNAEAATETANTAASTATQAAADAKAATEASNTQTQAAKDATDAANEAAANANAKADRADASATKADTAAEGADTSASGADEAAKRANDAAQRAEDGEDARDQSEKERTQSETERQTSETERAEAEQKRAEAETERESAELERAKAATEQAKQQADNNVAQAKNDEAQAKNNSDQAANNLAAQGRLTRILKPGEYDPETREPTIEGDLTHVFAVPTAESEAAAASLAEAQTAYKQAQHTMSDAAGAGPQFEGQLTSAQQALAAAQAAYEAANRYVEWLWLLDAEGTGYWELYGSGNSTLPDPISTEEYDKMWAGEPVETKHVSYSNGEAYNVTKTKAAIAEAVSEQATAQSATDQAQNEAIEAAKRAGDDAASALDSYKTTQSQTDKDQDKAIQEAKDAAQAAAEAIPPTVTSEAGGILPAFPAEGGPLYPVVKDGELIGWQAIPVFDFTQAGLVPVAPPEGGGTKVLLNTGWGEYKGGGMPDSRPLKAAIAAAEKAKTETKVQGGGDYDFGTNVTTQAELDKLTQAIAAAQAVLDSYDNPNTTQAMLDAAKSTLDQAVSAFEGTLSPLQPDKSQLTALEKRYDDLKKDVVVSTDGKDVPFGSKWTTSAEKLAADTALQAAQTSVEAATKQSQIKSACDTLDTALDTYESARKTATKDTAALDRAIQAANDAKADVKTSDSEGSDLPSGSQYVTSAQMKALTDALSAATGAKESASTQAAIDKATSDLTSATSTFQGQVKTNWSAPSSLSGASADDLARVSDLAKEDPTTYYNKYKGQTFTLAMQNTTYSAATITVRCDDAGNMDRVAGGKNGLHFTIIQGLKPQQMNTSATTSGGYKGSNFYTKILPEIIKALPADIQSRLDNLYVDVNLQSSGSTITPVEGKMHLVTMNQWYGPDCSLNSYQSWAPAWWKNEETFLKWNAEHNTQNDKIVKNDSGAANGGWTASVRNSANFGCVNGNGFPDYSNASSSYVPVLGFSLTNNG